MKIAHINAGNEYGGGLSHIVLLLKALTDNDADLIVFEDGPVAEAARREGIPVYVLKQNSRYELKVLSRLRTFLKEQQYAIVHTHGPRANTLISLLRPFIKAKWIMTVHSNPLLDFKDRGIKGRLFERIHLLTFKKADGIIAVSNEIKNILPSFGVAQECIKVIHNGIRFKGSEQSNIKKDPKLFTVVTVGRLSKVKGYSLLMEALKTAEFKEWQWVICGDGEEMDNLKQLADMCQLSRHLNFKGWLSSEEIRKELQQADVFISPSLSEGFPMIVLEAADEKVPVIATDVGDVREVIKDSSMGWLIPSGSKERLNEAVSQAYSLWTMNQLSKKGENLNDWASRFSIEKQAQAVQEVYKKVTAVNRK